MMIRSNHASLAGFRLAERTKPYEVSHAAGIFQHSMLESTLCVEDCWGEGARQAAPNSTGVDMDSRDIFTLAKNAHAHLSRNVRATLPSFPVSASQNPTNNEPPEQLWPTSYDLNCETGIQNVSHDDQISASPEISDNDSFQMWNPIGSENKLLDEVIGAYILAKETYSELNQSQLLSAYTEAAFLAGSGLFGDKIIPQIGVDTCGEFIFWHRTDVSYIDIGVCGEGVLSYHVRDLARSELTVFDDYDWADFDIPKRLFDALDALRQIL